MFLRTSLPGFLLRFSDDLAENSFGVDSGDMKDTMMKCD